MQPALGLIPLLCAAGLLLASIPTGQSVLPDGSRKSAVVRVWLKSYTYPYKLKANRDWCNPARPNEPCSPAFLLCFIQSDTRPDTCDAQIKFGGSKTLFANRNVVRFGNNLAPGLSNPIEFYLDQWKAYPTLNLTVTNDDHDVTRNLIAQGTVHMDKLDRPALTKWRAKWHKVTLRLAGGKMTILLYYQAYEARSYATHRQAVRLQFLEKVTEPVTIDPAESENDEDLEETVHSHAGGEHKIFKTVVRPQGQLNVGPNNIKSTNNGTPTTIPTSTEHHTATPITTATTNTTTVNPKNITSTTTVEPTSTTKTTSTMEPTTTPLTTTTSTTVTTTPCDSTTTTTTVTTTTTDAPHQLSTGAIVGLAVGLGLLAILLLSAGILCYKYRDVVFAGYVPLDH